MKTTLDEDTCLSQLQLARNREVGFKFKQKVLDALSERDLLPSRRPAGRKQATLVAPRRARARMEPPREPTARLASSVVLQVEESGGGVERANGTTGQLDAALAARLGAPVTAAGQYQALATAATRFGAARGCSSRAQPRTYPNNTLIEDLSRCHKNLLPKVTRASARTVELLRSCLPTGPPPCAGRPGQKHKRGLPETSPGGGGGGEGGGYVDKNIIQAVAAGHLEDELAANEDNDEGRKQNPIAIRLEPKRRAKFPMPESILRLNSSLKQDDYDRALCMLTNDVRYQLHLLLYQRLQTIWTLFSTILCILIPLLLGGAPEAPIIACACALWLGLQVTGIATTRQFRKKLDQMLERAVAQVNSYFMDHRLMLGVINAGGLLKRARLVIPMLYFDTLQCRQLAKKIILRYSQRWISYFDRRKLMFTDEKAKPRHLSTGKCLCQFIEEHFKREDLDHDEKLTSAEKEPNGMDERRVAPPAHKKPTANNKSSSTIESLSTNNHPSSPIETLEALVPTLSELVSSKERLEQFRLSLDSRSCQSFKLSQLHHELSPTDSGSTPGAAELSLELADSSELLLATRNDELMRKLLLLMESRKTEPICLPGGLDSQLTPSLSMPTTTPMKTASQSNGTSTTNNDNNNYISYTSRFPNAMAGDKSAASLTASSLPQSPASLPSDHQPVKPNSPGAAAFHTQVHRAARGYGPSEQNSSGANAMSQIGKRFFNQADGIFLSSKRSQPGVYAKQQQVLEIC